MNEKPAEAGLEWFVAIATMGEVVLICAEHWLNQAAFSVSCAVRHLVLIDGASGLGHLAVQVQVNLEATFEVPRLGACWAVNIGFIRVRYDSWHDWPPAVELAICLARIR
jgi:hypothetical protein